MEQLTTALTSQGVPITLEHPHIGCGAYANVHAVRENPWIAAKVYRPGVELQQHRRRRSLKLQQMTKMTPPDAGPDATVA